MKLFKLFKRATLILVIVLVVVLIAWSIFGWFMRMIGGNLLALATSNPAGAEFLAAYPGAIDYERSTTDVLYLRTIAGSNAIELDITLSGEAPTYELTCYQAPDGIVYFTLSGTAEEVITKIKAKECFDLGGNTYQPRPE